MEFNAVLSSTLGLKFLVLRTQLEASWATPPIECRRHDFEPLNQPYPSQSLMPIQP